MSIFMMENREERGTRSYGRIPEKGSIEITDRGMTLFDHQDNFVMSSGHPRKDTQWQVLVSNNADDKASLTSPLNSSISR